ncbi:MAG: hypothetical protein LBV74_03110 [Tannerella sp.]|jgi:hypothetical protein|nr:hypothetical protein [Tannerella sp.]
MIPVWIINLARESIDSSYLKQLHGELSGHKKSYWFYTELEAGLMTDESSCRLLLNELIMQGRACYNHFQEEGYVINNLQICIVGAITEPVTRTSFHLIPSLLREFLPSIQSKYVYRGVEITGLLFIPHNMNQAPAAERAECALFAEELNTLVVNLSVDTYNRIVVCQDIQRPDVGERFYGTLDKQRQTGFIFQLLLQLYFCDEQQPKIFDAQELNKSGFYSLGAASIYYDSREHKERKASGLLKKLAEMMKDPANVSAGDTEHMVSAKFPAASVSAETVLDRLKENCQGLNVDLKTLEALPDPHPVTNFYKAKLYISYYLDYLKFMPARALEFTRLYAHMLTKKIFGQIGQNMLRLKECSETILNQYNRIFTELDCAYPTFPQLKNALEELKVRFRREKERAERLMAREEHTVFEVPGYLSVYYNQYKSDETDVSEKEIVGKMKDELKWEPTIMSVLNRSLLLGTVMVFVLMPLLRHISPFIINLGDVDKYAYIWITFIFLAPFLFQFGRLRRHFLRIRNYKRMLLAKSLVKVQQKSSEMLYRQALEFYTAMIKACDEAIGQYELIEQKLHVEEKRTYRPEVPGTYFNQSLTDGSFNGKKILLKPDVIGDDIRIEGSYVKLSGIRKEDYFRILKEMFKRPEACLFKVAGDSVEMIDKEVKLCLEEMEMILRDSLKINEWRSLAKMVNDLSQKFDSAIDLNPLFRMAEINGVITDSTSERGVVIRSYDKLLDIPKGLYNIRSNDQDKEAEKFIFVTTWSRPYINKLNVSSICDMEMKLPAGALPFSSLLTCLYAQYKKKDNHYRIGDVKVPVSTETLQQLELTINKMKP